MKKIIFYGADERAAKKLGTLAEQGLIPTCFCDSDIRKHYTKFSSIDGSVTYEILPLLEAIRRYPDYEIYLTHNTIQILKETTVYLITIGVHIKNIKYCQPVEWRKGCHDLDSLLWFGRHVLQACCSASPPSVPYSGNLQSDFYELKKLRETITEKLRNDEPTTCDGCPHLRYDLWKKTKNKSTRVSLYGGFKGEKCNFKCCYCNSQENLKLAQAGNNNISLLEAIEQLSSVTEIMGLILNAGEITISPNVKELLQLVKTKKIATMLLTNGFVFNEDIADLMRMGRASVNVSLDAGTPETYAKIKGVDCFEKVLHNLAEYSSTGGYLALKYILLEGVNDNEADINGFIQIASRLAKTVVLSFDTFKIKNQLSEHMLNMTSCFFNKARSANLPVTVDLNTLGPVQGDTVKSLYNRIQNTHLPNL